MSFRMGASSLLRAPLAARSFSSTSSQSDFARMSLLGRLTAAPEVRTTKTGKDYVKYSIATSDPSGPAGENGERPEPTTSFHNVFAFGEGAVTRLTSLTKGSLVMVEAEFKVANEPATDSSPSRQNFLVQHRSIHVIKRHVEAEQ